MVDQHKGWMSEDAAIGSEGHCAYLPYVHVLHEYTL